MDGVRESTVNLKMLKKGGVNFRTAARPEGKKMPPEASQPAGNRHFEISKENRGSFGGKEMQIRGHSD